MGASTAAHAEVKTVVDFQPFKYTASTTFNLSGQQGRANLTSLNTNVNELFVLDVQWPGSPENVRYSLEIPDPLSYSVELAQQGLKLRARSGQVIDCPLFSQAGKTKLNTKTGSNYQELCGGALYQRRHALNGSSGGLKEWGANYLRDNVGSAGEALVEDVKDVTLDSEKRLGVSVDASSASQAPTASKDRPVAAHLNAFGQQKAIQVNDLTIPLAEVSNTEPLKSGAWYTAKNHKGVFVSLIRPGMVADDIMGSFLNQRVRPLDEVERNVVSYMVAFDLNQFTVGWQHGVNLPGVGWSTRNNARIAGQEGPDGFGKLDSIQTTGQLNPAYLTKLEGVMCGGFQRHHGVFTDQHGNNPMAKENLGTYFGFMQDGAVMSKLNNGLASMIMYTDGHTDIHAWTDADTANLKNIRSVRQNAMPLVQPDPAHPTSGVGVPGEFVSDWIRGDWSGSPKSERRSARAGVCISHQNGHRYLIYGFFSSVNPDSMARVFQAYECQNAMHLDMNSAGQGYLGLVNKLGSQINTEVPVKEMSALNTKVWIDGKASPAPRYVGTPDNADFFYILRK